MASATSTTLPAPTTTVAPDTSDEGATWLTADQPGSNVLAAFDPEDRLVVGYWTSVDGAVRVLRCADSECLGPKELFTLGSLSFFEAPDETLEPYLMDMAWRFDPGLDRLPTKLATYQPFWGGSASLAQGGELLVIFSGEGGGLQLVSGSMDEVTETEGSPCKE